MSFVPPAKIRPAGSGFKIPTVKSGNPPNSDKLQPDFKGDSPALNTQGENVVFGSKINQLIFKINQFLTLSILIII